MNAWGAEGQTSPNECMGAMAVSGEVVSGMRALPVMCLCRVYCAWPRAQVSGEPRKEER